MTRFYDYSPNVAVGAGASTVTIPYQFLRGDNVVAYEIAANGTGNLGATQVLERVRVLINSTVWWDISMSFLNEWLRTVLRPAKLNLGATTRLILPFFDPLAPTQDMADECQLPVGNPELQLQFGGNTTAGNLNVGIVRSNITPTGTTRLWSQAMNIPASQRNQSYTFNAAGTIRGLIMNSVGIERATVQLGGIEAVKITGPQYSPATNLLGVTQAYESGQIDQDPKVFLMGDAYTAPGQGTGILLDTGSAWDGVGNELGIWTKRALSAAA